MSDVDLTKHYNDQIETAGVLLDAIADRIDEMPDGEVTRIHHGHLGKMIDVCATLSGVSHDIHKFLDFIRRGEKDE